MKSAAVLGPPGDLFRRKDPRMKMLFTRKRLAMGFSALGVTLMGVDIMMTHSFFIHVGELMAASIICFVMGIVLDRAPRDRNDKNNKSGRRKFNKGLKAS